MFMKVGEIGTPLDLYLYRAGIAVDVTTLSKQLIAISPSGAIHTFTGTQIGGAGNEHGIRYTTTSADDIDEEGRWSLEGRYYNGGGTIDFRSMPISLDVYPNIE